MINRWMAAFSCGALLAPTFSRELRAQDPDPAARQIIEDVCQAVGCNVQTLHEITTRPELRLGRLRQAACGGDLDAVFAALGAPADPALAAAVDRATALRIACQLVSGSSPASFVTPGGGTLGIPQKAMASANGWRGPRRTHVM